MINQIQCHRQRLTMNKENYVLDINDKSDWYEKITYKNTRWFIFCFFRHKSKFITTLNNKCKTKKLKLKVKKFINQDLNYQTK